MKGIIPMLIAASAYFSRFYHCHEAQTPNVAERRISSRVDLNRCEPIILPKHTSLFHKVRTCDLMGVLGVLNNLGSLLSALIALPKKCVATESTLKISCANYLFVSGNSKLYIGENEQGKNVLSISDLKTGDCIFSSVPGKAFLQAGFHENCIKENHASFHVLENTVRHTLDQRIHAIVQVGNTVTITGTILRDIKGKTDIHGQEIIIPYELSLSFGEKDKINISCRVLRGANFIHFIYASSEDEKIYGLGEQYTYLNQKGHEVPILVQEQGIGSGHPYITPIMNFLAGAGGTPYTTYVSIPQYITHEGLSFEVKNAEYAVFNFKEKDSNTLRIFSEQFDITLIHKNSVMEAIEARAQSFNHPPKVPDWLNKGAVVGMQGGTSRVLEVLNALEKRKTPIAALWLQDWVGKRKNLIGEQLWWNWELDETHYPHWDELVKTCRSKKIRLMGYINPYLVKVNKKENVERDLFSEAKAYGYLVRKENGDLYPLEITTFSSYLLDLSNPHARTWMKEIIKTQMIDKGFSGWMADFGEGLPLDALLYSGEAKSFHNRYPEEWTKLNLEAIREAGKENEITFFARSGFTRSPESVPLLWTGDQNHTDDEFDGMKAALRAMNGSGFSGFKHNHSDIGGYTTLVLPFTRLGWVRTEDLLFRWMAMNAFTCVFRTHEGLKPEINAQFYSNERCYDMFDHFAKVYESLAFYRQKLEHEAQSFGRPITRHPVLHYPHDSVIANLEDQFMLGDEIMVAPVFNQQDFEKGHHVYLPKGTWVSPWRNSADSLQLEYRHNKGEWITVKSDYKHPPVFYKKGSLIGAQFIKNLAAHGIDSVTALD